MTQQDSTGALGWGLRYAPSLNVVATDVALERRLETYAALGLTAVEYSCAGQPDCGLMQLRPDEVATLRAKVTAYGLEMGTFVANPGSARGAGLCDPRQRGTFLGELARALEYRDLLGNRYCTVLVGPEADGVTREAQRASVIEGLQRAAELVGERDLTWVVEPVNRVDAPRAFLSDSDEAASIVTAVGSADHAPSRLHRLLPARRRARPPRAGHGRAALDRDPACDPRERP